MSVKGPERILSPTSERPSSPARGSKLAKPHTGLLSLTIAIALPFTAAIVGGLATAQSVITWYPTLRKPRWNPPSWIFGPVWNLLYLLMGVASWLVWRQGESTTPTGAPPCRARQQRSGALTLYGIQLALNALWSVIFFGMRRIDLALLAIVPLWSAVLATLITFYRVHPLAGLLLIPYQAWSTFAALLNLRIWQLNGKK